MSEPKVEFQKGEFPIIILEEDGAAFKLVETMDDMPMYSLFKVFAKNADGYLLHKMNCAFVEGLEYARKRAREVR